MFGYLSIHCSGIKSWEDWYLSIQMVSNHVGIYLSIGLKSLALREHVVAISSPKLPCARQDYLEMLTA